MAAIIAIHSDCFPEDFTRNFSSILIKQIFKFGTICFFIISGFLLGDKLNEVKPLEYFKKRLNSTFIPWLFWSCLYSLALIVMLIFRSQFTFLKMGHVLIQTLLYTNYWFVPNFLLALGLLLFFRKNFDKQWFGLFLFTGSLFYGINLYHGWLPTQHTTALLGFVFYLWLGVQFNVHRDRLMPFVDSLRPQWLMLGLMFSYALCILETYLLVKTPTDILNILRISNQIYSVTCFIAFLKIKRPITPLWMDPRKYTYGLYLTHWINMTFVFSILSRLASRFYNVNRTVFADNPFAYVASPWLRILIWVFSFLFIYFSSLFLVITLGRTKLRSLVGVRVSNKTIEEK